MSSHLIYHVGCSTWSTVPSNIESCLCVVRSLKVCAQGCSIIVQIDLDE